MWIFRISVFLFIPFRGYLPGTSKRKTGQFRCDLLRCEAECVDVPFLQRFLQIDLSALAAKHSQKKKQVFTKCVLTFGWSKLCSQKKGTLNHSWYSWMVIPCSSFKYANSTAFECLIAISCLKYGGTPKSSSIHHPFYSRMFLINQPAIELPPAVTIWL